MVSINKLVKNCKTPSDFAKHYFLKLNEILNNIPSKHINIFFNILESCRVKKKSIFVIGNGGSSSTASTMANDISFDILKKSSTKIPFKVISLVDNVPLMTAISNDINYESIFSEQLKISASKNDLLIVISASGNSKNLIQAVNYAKSIKMKTFALLGFNGGKLINLCDNYIHIKTENDEYGLVEDSHLILNHLIAHWFQIKLKK